MTELKGFEERRRERRVKGAEHGVHPDRKSWLERRSRGGEAELGTTPSSRTA